MRLVGLMNKRLKWIAVLGILSVFTPGALIGIFADEDRQREKAKHSGENDPGKNHGCAIHPRASS